MAGSGVSAWQILVSEFMLQQTPVARVAPIWVDWVRRWPTPSATAAAGAADVLRAWGKLGYPRRAKRLHECATVIAAEHGDVVPDDVDTLLGLPGVGAYTARAIACFAYGRRVPVVDTNVRRVVARAVHGRADAGNPSAVRDHADVEALLPDERLGGGVLGGADGTGCDGVHGAVAQVRNLPAECVCAWRAAGYPGRRGSGAAGAALRRNRPPGAREAARCAAGQHRRRCSRARLDVVVAGRHRPARPRLDSLLIDGLVEQTADGRFALCWRRRRCGRIGARGGAEHDNTAKATMRGADTATRSA